MSALARRLAFATFAASVALALDGLPTPATAQSPVPNPTPAVSDWIGVWRGPFITDGPSGTMILGIEQQDGAWKIVNDMEGDEVPPKTDVREWKVEGASFTFVQTFGEYDVFFRGSLEAGTIKGTLEAYEAGSLVGTGSFTLTRE